MFSDHFNISFCRRVPSPTFYIMATNTAQNRIDPIGPVMEIRSLDEWEKEMRHFSETFSSYASLILLSPSERRRTRTVTVYTVSITAITRRVVH